MLEAVKLRKEYPGTLALDDMSIKFEAGKVHALIGKNGAGKSTLVKMLAGAIDPTRGKILVEGKEGAVALFQFSTNAFSQSVSRLRRLVNIRSPPYFHDPTLRTSCQ